MGSKVQLFPVVKKKSSAGFSLSQKLDIGSVNFVFFSYKSSKQLEFVCLGCVGVSLRT